MPKNEHAEQLGAGRGMARRKLLKLGALAGALLLPMPALARPVPPESERIVTLYNVHTGEQLRTLYWSGGSYLPDALRQIDFILRDIHSNTIKRTDPRLVDLLHRIEAKLGAGQGIEVLCGYRTPKTNALLRREGMPCARNSFHLSAQAVDLRVPGRSLRQVHRAAMALRGGGVGYYPHAHFVHVDVGPVRYWHR
jgi:uncharacterized protein YcbK (DUF882 family)